MVTIPVHACIGLILLTLFVGFAVGLAAAHAASGFGGAIRETPNRKPPRGGSPSVPVLPPCGPQPGASPSVPCACLSVRIDVVCGGTGRLARIKDWSGGFSTKDSIPCGGCRDCYDLGTPPRTGERP